MKIFKKSIMISLIPLGILLLSCSSPLKFEEMERTTIGLLAANTDGLPWLRAERYFRAKADEFGVKILSRIAGDDQGKQNKQARDLIGEGIGVLVILPVDSGTACEVVKLAHQSDIPVVSYDNLIRDAEVDLYIAPDWELAGYLQCRNLLERSSGGISVMLNSDQDSDRSRLIRSGRIRALKEWEEKREIVIRFLDESIPSPIMIEYVRVLIERINEDIVSSGEKIGTLMAFEDIVAFGAIEALKDRETTGLIPVGGMEATLDACRRIIAGSQAITLYIPPREIGVAVFRAAVRLAGEMDPDDIIENLGYPERIMENGSEEIPALLVGPVIVTRSNMIETVVVDGLYTVREIYGE